MVRGYVSYYHSVVGWLVLTCMRQDAENLEDYGAGHWHQQLDMNRRCFQESTPASKCEHITISFIVGISLTSLVFSCSADEATVAGLVQNVSLVAKYC
jgi:hypothetical protein